MLTFRRFFSLVSCLLRRVISAVPSSANTNTVSITGALLLFLPVAVVALLLRGGLRSILGTSVHFGALDARGIQIRGHQ